MPATGPTSETGKAASSRNAVKHGLLSEAPVVTCVENHDEWKAHRAGVLADLAPNGQMEICLAERAALLIWRLRRTAQAEIHWLDDRYKDVPEKKRNRSYMPGFDAIICVTRYEAHLGRELARAMKALKDIQSRPTGESQSPIFTLQSPLSNAPTVEERTLNGSTPLRFDDHESSHVEGAVNYQTNSAPAVESSDTPLLHHSTTRAELNQSPSNERATGVERKNCETDSAQAEECSETPILHLSRPTREHPNTPAERDTAEPDLIGSTGPVTARDIANLRRHRDGAHRRGPRRPAPPDGIPGAPCRHRPARKEG